MLVLTFLDEDSVEESNFSKFIYFFFLKKFLFKYYTFFRKVSRSPGPISFGVSGNQLSKIFPKVT